MPEKYSFTMRREFERAKEEADLIEQLRNVSIRIPAEFLSKKPDAKVPASFQHIETRLKMALPEDLAPALTDGVVLCHLANHVRPRSVASIHVPSPAVVSASQTYIIAFPLAIIRQRFTIQSQIGQLSSWAT